MKQLNIFKVLMVIALFGGASAAIGQVHPLAFGPHTIAGGTTLSSSNWYKDYVGARVIVTAPSGIAGPVACSPAIIGPSNWPDIVWPAPPTLINVPIYMDVTDCDSNGGTAFPAGSMTGKIAVLWRGPIAGACYSGPTSTVAFTQKAISAQNAGALAIVIINEYAGAAPFSPGYTALGTPVHIPVLMIGNLDGIAISAVYHSSPANTVKMTLTPWGNGSNNDLGLVPNGQALWQYYAAPASEVAASNSAFNYKGMDGSFIANFGTHKATGTKLASALSFAGVDGVVTVVHRDTIPFEGDFTGAGTTDTLGDSIMAMFPGTYTEYNLPNTATGRYDMKYTVFSDSVDDFLADNTITNSFYLTDSLFSRGRYDFVNKRPLSNTYERYSNASEITWGDFYYIGKNNQYVSNVQYSISNGRTAAASDLIGSNDIYIFKWTDGSGTPPAHDSLVQDGELELISWTHHPYVSGVDTSNGVITQTVFYDSAQSAPANISLDSNSWYYVAIDIPAAVSDTLSLGIDGVSNPYPRIFGRWWETGGRYLDYSNFAGTNADAFTTNPAQAESPLPFTQVSFVSVVDSFSWTNIMGMIPSIALTTTGTISHVGVQNQAKPLADVSLYPNPASDHMNVSVALSETANTITYKIIDAVGRAVGSVTHNNVLSETYTINTGAMRAGTYFLLISADDKHTSKKFTVIK